MQVHDFLVYGDDDNHDYDNHGANYENDGSSGKWSWSFFYVIHFILIS